MSAIKPSPAAPDLAAWLARADEETFRSVVAADAKNRLDQPTAEALRDGRVLLRWQRMLKVLLLDAQVQLEEKRDDPARGHEWRVKVRRWHASLVVRKAEVNRLIGEQPSAASAEEALAERRRRGEAGEAALQRLVDAHRDEFDRYLAEECLAAGVRLSRRAEQALKRGREVTLTEARERIGLIRSIRRDDADD